jgi:hypothetical protein
LLKSYASRKRINTLREIRDSLYMLKGDACTAYEQAESDLMECEIGEGEI